MEKFFVISLLPAILFTILKTKKSLHMLQQSYYDDGLRYLKWIWNNRYEVFLSLDLVFICFGFLGLAPNNIVMTLFLFIYIVILITYFNKVKNETSKLPLNFTKRIRRLCVTVLIIYLLPFISIIFTYDRSLIAYYYLSIGGLIYFNYFIIYIANIINQPIEKLVYLHYKRQAIRKLKSMPNMDVIGITGSYGKTTTKNCLNEILSTKYNVFPTPKNFNSAYGLINTVNNYLDRFNDYFIAEMGAYRIGEIKIRSDIVNPKYGILTKIGVAHLETFGSEENIQTGKFELIEHLPSDGVAILNKDDELQTSYKIKNHVKVIWISAETKAEVYATDIKADSNGMKFKCHFKDTVAEFETRLLGKANIYNILESLALAHYLGVSIEQMQVGVKKIKPSEHRLELKKNGHITYIDDAYNSNPIGSNMALDVLNLMDGKKIVVTPGMIELGAKQYEANFEFGKHIAEVADEVILVGSVQTKPIQDGLSTKNFKNIFIVNDVKEAFMIINKLANKKTYVLLENDLPDMFNEGSKI